MVGGDQAVPDPSGKSPSEVRAFNLAGPNKRADWGGQGSCVVQPPELSQLPCWGCCTGAGRMWMPPQPMLWWTIFATRVWVLDEHKRRGFVTWRIDSVPSAFPVKKRFSHLQWRRLFKEIWGRPTTTADFGSSFRQIPYTSNVCLLEDKIQDRGLYLFTIPYGSFAMDQRSGNGWLSGWFSIFVINTRYFNAEFWSTWCEDCFSAEQNHP